ncbi:hypothetical protein ACFWUP_31305 [Nocardia sp. NPDC058658]|uniref:hypothetical protein n=1 Tax=Nocardia sp. NPDC058658 TaxID=3346580 RepID=UPI003654CC94
MTTNSGLRRAAVLGVGLLAIGVGTVIGSPCAVADSISPYHGLGTTIARISTSPGGFIDFTILMPGAGNGTCTLLAIPIEVTGATAPSSVENYRTETPMIVGFASGRIGPLANGSYDIGAGTGCQTSNGGGRVVGSSQARESSERWVQVIATLDGGSQVQADPLPPSTKQQTEPSKSPKTLSESCSAVVEGITGSYVVLPGADQILDAAGVTIRYFCGLVGDQATRSEQWCRAVEDFLWGFVPSINLQRLDHDFGNPETYCR